MSNRQKYLKYNPRENNCGIRDDAKSDVVVKKEGKIWFGNLRFEIFPAVEQTPRSGIKDVFEYVAKVAEAMQILHDTDGIAHYGCSVRQHLFLFQRGEVHRL